MESERTVGGRRSPTVVTGPLADYAAGFRRFLIAQGYARRTITVQVSLMAHLSRWLQAEGLTVDALRSSADIDRFFAERRARGHSSACDRGSARGRRDYAILMLLTRLGLRAGEV